MKQLLGSAGLLNMRRNSSCSTCACRPNTSSPMACRPASSPSSSLDISKSSPLSARFVVRDAMTRTTSSRERFSLPRACARLGSFQTAGSSSSALTSARRRDFSSQSKMSPELSGALSQVGDLGAQGVDAFDVHVKSCESWVEYGKRPRSQWLEPCQMVLFSHAPGLCGGATDTSDGRAR